MAGREQWKGMFVQILSRIFGSACSIERKLENQYVPFLQSRLGLSYSQSISLFNDLMKMMKEESKHQGTAELPSGDFILENENTDQVCKDLLKKLRKEGVRDEDVRWWWNLHDFEKGMIKKFDLINKNNVLTKLSEEEKMTPDELKEVFRKYFPLYGDPEDATHGSGDHRPLPYELNERIKKYIDKRLAFDRDAYRKDLDLSESFNSLIRKEMNHGNL
jgi:hypothetical protein